MTRNRRLFVAAFLSPPLLAAQDFPEEFGTNAVMAVDQFVVINNTNQTLNCASKSEGAWSSWFAVAPGAEWSDTAFDDPRLQFQCQPPVRRVVYTLLSGKRYSLLRAKKGQVHLSEIIVR